MKIGQAWEKRWHGGPKPTWRLASDLIGGGRGSPIARSIRVLTNRKAKKASL